LNVLWEVLFGENWWNSLSFFIFAKITVHAKGYSYHNTCSGNLPPFCVVEITKKISKSKFLATRSQRFFDYFVLFWR
jgi:hypothetical protein